MLNLLLLPFWYKCQTWCLSLSAELLQICAAAPFLLISTPPPRFQVAAGALETPFMTNLYYKSHTWHKGSSSHLFLSPSSPPCPPLTCHQLSGASRHFWTQIVSWLDLPHFTHIYTHSYIFFCPPLILPCSRGKQIKVWNQLNLCQITYVVVCQPRNVSHGQTIWCYTMPRQKLIFWVLEVASVWLQSAWVSDLGHWDWHLFLKWWNANPALSGTWCRRLCPASLSVLNTHGRVHRMRKVKLTSPIQVP